MSPNMSSLDRALRAMGGLVAMVVAISIGAGSVGGIVLFALAAVLLATSAVGFCPLYRLIGFDSRGRRPIPH